MKSPNFAIHGMKYSNYFLYNFYSRGVHSLFEGDIPVRLWGENFDPTLGKIFPQNIPLVREK